MKQTRRNAIVLGIALAMGCISVAPCFAQGYPSRPIKIIHGFAAGGAADTMSRIVADGLSAQLGQPVIVEAKPGAGGNIAAELVAQSQPDGYTIGLVTGAHSISAALYKHLGYKPVDSFDMISTLADYALVIAVRNDSPIKSLSDLIAAAKQNPAAMSFGSVGFGSTHHLAGELLNSMAGISMQHIPYRGDSQAITALLGGEVPVIVGTPVLIAPQMEGGAVRGLAVTSATRLSVMPQIPTVAEAGVRGYDLTTWAGLLAPKGLPPAILDHLNAATRKMLNDPQIAKRLEAAIGGTVHGSTPDEMKERLETEIKKATAIVDAAKLQKI